MQLPQPSSSAVSPTVAQANGDELLSRSETGYGPYGGHTYGGHVGHHGGGLGGGGGGGDLAVVVTGGYKVADAPHHGISNCTFAYVSNVRDRVCNGLRVL